MKQPMRKPKVESTFSYTILLDSLKTAPVKDTNAFRLKVAGLTSSQSSEALEDFLASLFVTETLSALLENKGIDFLFSVQNLQVHLMQKMFHFLLEHETDATRVNFAPKFFDVVRLANRLYEEGALLQQLAFFLQQLSSNFPFFDAFFSFVLALFGRLEFSEQDTDSLLAVEERLLLFAKKNNHLQKGVAIVELALLAYREKGCENSFYKVRTRLLAGANIETPTDTISVLRVLLNCFFSVKRDNNQNRQDTVLNSESKDLLTLFYKVYDMIHLRNCAKKSVDENEQTVLNFLEEIQTACKEIAALFVIDFVNQKVFTLENFFFVFFCNFDNETDFCVLDQMLSKIGKHKFTFLDSFGRFVASVAPVFLYSQGFVQRLAVFCEQLSTAKDTTLASEVWVLLMDRLLFRDRAYQGYALLDREVSSLSFQMALPKKIPTACSFDKLKKLSARLLCCKAVVNRKRVFSLLKKLLFTLEKLSVKQLKHYAEALVGWGTDEDSQEPFCEELCIVAAKYLFLLESKNYRLVFFGVKLVLEMIRTKKQTNSPKGFEPDLRNISYLEQVLLESIEKKDSYTQHYFFKWMLKNRTQSFVSVVKLRSVLQTLVDRKKWVFRQKELDPEKHSLSFFYSPFAVQGEVLKLSELSEEKTARYFCNHKKMVSMSPYFIDIALGPEEVESKLFLLLCYFHFCLENLRLLSGSLFVLSPETFRVVINKSSKSQPTQAFFAGLYFFVLNETMVEDTTGLGDFPNIDFFYTQTLVLQEAHAAFVKPSAQLDAALADLSVLVGETSQLSERLSFYAKVAKRLRNSSKKSSASVDIDVATKLGSSFATALCLLEADSDQKLDMSLQNVFAELAELSFALLKKGLATDFLVAATKKSIALSDTKLALVKLWLENLPRFLSAETKNVVFFTRLLPWLCDSLQHSALDTETGMLANEVLSLASLTVVLTVSPNKELFRTLFLTSEENTLVLENPSELCRKLAEKLSVLLPLLVAVPTNSSGSGSGTAPVNTLEALGTDLGLVDQHRLLQIDRLLQTSRKTFAVLVKHFVGNQVSFALFSAANSYLITRMLIVEKHVLLPKLHTKTSGQDSADLEMTLAIILEKSADFFLAVLLEALVRVGQNEKKEAKKWLRKILSVGKKFVDLLSYRVFGKKEVFAELLGNKEKNKDFSNEFMLVVKGIVKVQKSTRKLHWVCNTVKQRFADDSSLAALVPGVIRSLEMFMYNVGKVMKAANISEAYSQGTLNKRVLETEAECI